MPSSGYGPDFSAIFNLQAFCKHLIMKQHLPNAITLSNLFFGCCALVTLFTRQWEWTFGFVAAGVAADYLDGLVARWLKVHSELGKELDSLADLITFGLVPGAIFYSLLLDAWALDGQRFSWLAAPGFFVSVFAGLRLAIFNLDERQADSFLGLPTPSAAIFSLGLLLIAEVDSLGLGRLLENPYVLYGLIIFLANMLVAEVPMFSLKFKDLSWRGNEVRYIFLGLMVLLLFLIREAAFSTIILLYILFSLLQKYLKPATR